MCKICGFKTEKITINSVLYHKCLNCGFLSKDESYIISDEMEYERYKLHNNNDENYLTYQNNFYEMIKDYLNGDILDYGCGDNHVLSTILCKNGYDSFYYDLYFYKNEDVFVKSYDVIILEEVIEHLMEPILVLKRLSKLLKKDGRLIIRTNFIKDGTNLNSWWYLRDITHISFFTLNSFSICSQLLGLNIIYCNEKDIIIMKKA